MGQQMDGFGLFGAAVLLAQGNVRRLVTGSEASAASYGPVCPGVAVSAMLQVFINKGLVGAGLVAKFGAPDRSLSVLPCRRD